MCASEDTSALEEPQSSKITSSAIARGLHVQTACCPCSQSQRLVPKNLLECFVLIRFKQLKQGKLHNPFAL